MALVGMQYHRPPDWCQAGRPLVELDLGSCGRAAAAPSTTATLRRP